MGGSSSKTSIGAGQINDEGCPIKFETYLVDIDQEILINTHHNLSEGTSLKIEITNDNKGISFTYKEVTIGFMPPDWLIIINCIKKGWEYNSFISKIIEVDGVFEIKVIVVGNN